MHSYTSLVSLYLPYRDWLLESFNSQFRLFRLCVRDFHRVYQMSHVALSTNYSYWQSTITATAVNVKRCTCLVAGSCCFTGWSFGLPQVVVVVDLNYFFDVDYLSWECFCGDASLLWFRNCTNSEATCDLSCIVSFKSPNGTQNRCFESEYCLLLSQIRAVVN